MQNVGQPENRNIDKVNVQLDVVKSSTPQSSSSSPAKSETETYSGAPAKYMTDSSESEDDSVSEVKRVLFWRRRWQRECDYLYRSLFLMGHLRVWLMLVYFRPSLHSLQTYLMYGQLRTQNGP